MIDNDVAPRPYADTLVDARHQAVHPERLRRPGIDARRGLRQLLASATEEDVAAICPRAVRERLAAVKRQYDPARLFAGNHDIRPSQGRAPFPRWQAA
ncbi:hypothetical protein [Nonomuraea sp. C10]|uniref:hypothetical protein n=1 Tax=Nonomuraea sp. C10 TaxID=2600577 RepID=UPI00164EE377|nr:hypothetical protein [Nonomuraea sp. C10]